MCVTYFSCGSVHYFLQGTWFNKIVLCKLLLFSRYWLETQKSYVLHEVFMYTTFCVDQSIIFWRGALLNKIKWRKLYFSSFRNIDLKLLTYIRHEVYMWITYFSSGSVHYFLEGNDLTKSWMRTNTFSRYWLETVIIKCRCGQNIFHMDQSILFLKGAL